jgi:predicted transcriptional regulator
MNPRAEDGKEKFLKKVLAFQPSSANISVTMKLAFRTEQVVDNLRTGLDARALRTSRGLSLRAVAQKMRVSAAYLSDLELGRRNWSETTLEKVTAAITNAATLRKRK